MWHVAQMNVGTVLYPTDDPRIAEFMNQLDAVNAMADASPGFVWRLQSAQGNATDILVSDESVFPGQHVGLAGCESLFDFVYRTSHRLVMAKRREWFARPEGAYQVLWWIPAGSIPTPQEGPGAATSPGAQRPVVPRLHLPAEISAARHRRTAAGHAA